jgi:DNA-binding protein YbaB
MTSSATPTALLGDDGEVLEDPVAAVNDAVRKVEETTQQKMAGLTPDSVSPNLPF